MARYGITVNGRVTEVCDTPSPLPAWAQDDAAFLEKMFPGKTGWKAVPNDAVNGTVDNGDGTFTNPGLPPLPTPRPPSITRPRFDAIFAKGCGEAYYRRALRALKGIAATDPPTNDTAAIARGLDALNSPPSEGIDYPLTEDWVNSPSEMDITGSLLYAVVAALVNVGGFSDIETRINASLALWRNLKV